MPVSKVPTQVPKAFAKMRDLLGSVNRTYNDQPKNGAKPVLFLDEADSFVALARGLKQKTERVEVMRALARLGELGEGAERVRARRAEDLCSGAHEQARVLKVQPDRLRP